MEIVLDSSPSEASPIDTLALQSGLRRGRRRANLLLSLLIVMGFCYAAWLGIGTIKIFLFERGIPVESAVDEELTPIEIVEVVIALPSLPVLVASVIVWFFWLHRAYSNLQLVGLGKARYSPRWAIGSWFIPFVNLFVPYRAVVDLTLRSEDGNTWDYNEDAPGPDLVLTWWLLTFLSRVLDRLVYREPYFLDPAALNLVEIASNAVSLVWTALGFLIVLRVRDAQDRWRATGEAELAATV